jgi:hypothetical protein
MTDTIDPRRRHELRNKALRYIRLNGADKIKGQVPISELKSHLGATEDEYRALYRLLFNDQLAVTDGRNEHISLTPAGRAEADNLGC